MAKHRSRLKGGTIVAEGKPRRSPLGRRRGAALGRMPQGRRLKGRSKPRSLARLATHISDAFPQRSYRWCALTGRAFFYRTTEAAPTFAIEATAMAPPSLLHRSYGVLALGYYGS